MLAERKPEWLRVRPPSGENYAHLKSLFRSLDLHTVCEEAHCPNVWECWGGGTATIMLMGDTCTRGCRFCAVTSGNPHGVLDLDEPKKVAIALAEMDLSYVVLTSVDRDDLADGGAAHFAKTVREIKIRRPDMLVEALIPDFQGDLDAVRTVVDSGVDVLDHNIETVERLQGAVRDRRANYAQSLEVLRAAKEMRSDLFSKSSIMLGLGETRDEILATMRDLRANEVDIVTVGQYLRPSTWHIAVQEYVPPEVFEELRVAGESMGFAYVGRGGVPGRERDGFGEAGLGFPSLPRTGSGSLARVLGRDAHRPSLRERERPAAGPADAEPLRRARRQLRAGLEPGRNADPPSGRRGLGRENPEGRRRRADVLRRRRDERGRLPRRDELRRRLQDPDDLLLQEQPVGDLRADHPPDCLEDPRAEGHGIRLRRRPGGRQRSARGLRGDEGGRGQGPKRRRPNDDRSRHLSNGPPLLE